MVPNINPDVDSNTDGVTHGYNNIDTFSNPVSDTISYIYLHADADVNSNLETDLNADAHPNTHTNSSTFFNLYTFSNRYQAKSDRYVDAIPNNNFHANAYIPATCVTNMDVFSHAYLFTYTTPDKYSADHSYT